MDLNFASDNVVGASAPVLDALVRANAGSLPSYGADEITRRVERRLAELFEHEVAVLLVATGTAANALALSAIVEPWGICVCHEEAHIAEDECGAPEFFSGGAKLLGLPGEGAKITAEAVAGRIGGMSRAVHQMPAQAVSVSQATECGLVYRPDEVAAIGAVGQARGLRLHMDGARFGNALATLGCTAADVTWRAGVDMLSFGATKNGCLAAEAVVVFDPVLAGTLAYRRKRSGHLLSKARLVAAQLDAYLADDHWLANARHANTMAKRLSDGLVAVPGIDLAWPSEANEVFAILPEGVDAALRAAGFAFHPWSARALAPGRSVGNGRVLVRFVASFATEPGAVDALVRTAAGFSSQVNKP